VVIAWFGFVVLMLSAVCDQGAANGTKSAAPFLPSYDRIVSLSPLITENIFLLGAGDSLVGDTIYCQRPEAARHKAKVGSVQEISIEKIVSLRPQLILASNLTPPQQVEKLRQLGFRVEFFRQPASFADICSHFLRLGQLLGLEERAEAIVDQSRKKSRRFATLWNHCPAARYFFRSGPIRCFLR
jgi:iron complex transport system substrate-binding protein